MQDDDVKASMLEGMYKAMPESKKGYVNLEQPNANERDLTQPEDEDSQRIRMMKEAMFVVQARALKKYLKKRDGGLDTSESEAEAKETDDDKKLDFGLGQKISAKTMPPPSTPRTPRTAKAVGEARTKKTKVWRKKGEETSESEPEPAASSSSRPSKPASGSAGQTAKSKSTRPTSQRAKDLLKDAEAARNVFTRWTQEFANIQWFAHPGTKFPCTNNGRECECEEAMFWCHKCGSGYCLQCRYDGLACNHQIAHYSVDTDSAFLPDSISSAESCFNLKELFDNVNAESRYFGYDAGEQAAFRKDTIDDLYSRARAGDKVGGKLFTKFLNEGVEEYRRASDYSYVPANGRIPTLIEHYVEQQLHDMPVPIFRPLVMINAGKFEPLTEEEQYQMLSLYRNFLTTKSALTTGNRRTDQNVTESNMTSLTLSIVSLNLGHINRPPIMSGAFKFEKHIRESEKVLPHLVFNNGGHIITLCEASDDQGGIERHAGLCYENGCIGIVVHSHAAIAAPALACFMRGSNDAGSWLELIGHHQRITEQKESGKAFWSFNGAIFRCVFGRNTSGNMIDPSTGIRTQAPDSSDWTDKPNIEQFEALGTTMDLEDDECILVMQGRKDSEQEDMMVPAYSTGVTNRDVFRLGLSEVRIAVFHLSSFGWRSGWQEGCDNWLRFITAAIAAQVDFITGDGNLFAQRNFKADSHTDFKSSILIDLLERLLAEINPHRSGMNQITYNVCSSIQAGAYIRAMSGDRNVTNADCMILISLSYGKQTQVSLSRTASHKASADGVVGSGYSDEVMLQDVERVKYLQNIDLGLKDSDQAAHSPLIAIAKLYCQRNLRVRSEQSENRRRGRRGERQPRYREQQQDEEEEIEVEEDEEEENEPVGHLRSTTPSSGARYRGQERTGRYENVNRNLPVTPPKTPPAPPPRRRERSVTPQGRNTQQRTDRPTTPQRPPSQQRSWYQQQQDQYNYYSQPYQRSAPSAPIPTPPPPPPAPVRTQQRPARWGHQRTVEYANNYVPYTGPRWERRPDGSWFDRTPQFPWESIYYHLPTPARRWNELWLYGYTFSMGL
eukprot:s4149_g4.t1